jgi:CubicO group peptidase (beta-lactamase class C family)
MISFVLLSTFVLSAPIPSYAAEQTQQTETPSETLLTPESAAAFLDQFFASELVKPHYVGAAVVIVRDGQVIAQKGYGYANAAEQEKVDPEQTVFRIASVSKTFTAVAVMQLAEQGKIDLNEDIRAYLPGIEFDNPYDTPITVAHLLTHRSGFAARDPQKDDLHTDFDRYVSIEDYVNLHMPQVVREPGTSYMYDNFAYLLLGLIVQNVSGEPYEQYMENHLFKPLGMEHSGFELKGHLLERLATGYDAQNQPMEPYVFSPTIMPHGGMLATAEDIGKFMIAFLNGGETENGRILSRQSVEAMSEYRFQIHPLLPETTYGFEAAAQLPLAGSNDAILTKLGDLPGNSSLLLLIPEQKTGVFLTYNKNGALRDQFYGQFMAAFFPEYTVPQEFAEFQPPAADDLQQFTGLYADLRLPSIVSLVEADQQGKLTIRDAFLGPRTLRQVDDNLFVDELTQRFTAFKVDENNGTVYMKEPNLNPLGYARKGAKPVGFADVDETSAYAPYILALQSLGHYPNGTGEAFQPERPVTRAELVYHLLTISGLKGSNSPEYAFQDIAGHPLASYIQAANELGMAAGDGKGYFYPDRPATRQEAAVMVWNIYRQLYSDEWFAEVKLAGETAEWAIPAVKMAVALGLHGPEVTRTEDGAANFHSRQPVTREQAAAFMYQLLLQPVDQIVSERMKRQQSAAEQQS